MRLLVTVVPKSGRFEITQKEGKLRIFLKSPAESNKANLELVRELGRMLKCRVSIASGLASRKKTLEIPLKEEELKIMLKIS